MISIHTRSYAIALQIPGKVALATLGTLFRRLGTLDEGPSSARYAVMELRGISELRVYKSWTRNMRVVDVVGAQYREFQPGRRSVSVVCIFRCPTLVLGDDFELERLDFRCLASFADRVCSGVVEDGCVQAEACVRVGGAYSGCDLFLIRAGDEHVLGPVLSMVEDLEDKLCREIQGFEDGAGLADVVVAR